MSPDMGCTNIPAGYGCLRVANMSYSGSNYDVRTFNNQIVFGGVGFKEVTTFKQTAAGNYTFFVTASQASLTGFAELPVILLTGHHRRLLRLYGKRPDHELWHQRAARPGLYVLHHRKSLVQSVPGIYPGKLSFQAHGTKKAGTSDRTRPLCFLLFSHPLSHDLISQHTGGHRRV